MGSTIGNPSFDGPSELRKKHQKTKVRKGHQLLHFRFGTENIYKIVFCQKFKSGTVGTIERYSNLKITPLFL